MPTLKPAQAGFCLATMTDLPAVWALMDDYKHLYVDDFETLELPWVIQLINSQQLWVILNSNDYPIACIWYTDKINDLHITLHGIFRPKEYRVILKSNVIFNLLESLYEHTGVSKIKAAAMQHQTGATRLLSRSGFRSVGILSRETRYHGKAIDIILFEKTVFVIPANAGIQYEQKL